MSDRSDLSAIALRDARLLVSPVETVSSDWIDYNGHLNMAYYNVLFDRGVDAAFETFGLGPDYVTARNMSFFTMEAHTCYLGEIGAGDQTVTTFQIIDHDEKRVHYFEELYRLSDGLLSATSEQLAMHVDMAQRKSAPFPDDVSERIKETATSHQVISKPDRAGRAIGIRKRSD